MSATERLARGLAGALALTVLVPVAVAVCLLILAWRTVTGADRRARRSATSDHLHRHAAAVIAAHAVPDALHTADIRPLVSPAAQSATDLALTQRSSS